MYNLLLCDDNGVFLAQSQKIIAENYNGIFNIVVSENFDDGLKKCVDSNADIAVLDIELKDESGIDLAKLLNEKIPDCRIIFLTNHIGYATDVYSAEHTYFVVKEDMEKNLPRAIEKALSEIEAAKNDFITVSSKDRKRVLKVSDIFYCEHSGRTAKIYLENDSFTVTEKLDTLYESLCEKGFTRCHKSFIVNMVKVSEIFRNKYVFENGNEIPISRNYADATKTDFAKFMCRGV